MIGVYCPWSNPSWCNPAILAKVSLGRNRNCIANVFIVRDSSSALQHKGQAQDQKHAAKAVKQHCKKVLTQ
jgi:hypothetical protein